MKYGMLIILATFGLIASGCSHTIQGVQQDAEQNTPAVQAIAQQAGQTIAQTSKSADKAVSTNLTQFDRTAKSALVGTEIKAKIIADASLNGPGVDVVVETSQSAVLLKGHVNNLAQKAEAVKIARAAIVLNNGSLILKDELVVTAA